MNFKHPHAAQLMNALIIAAYTQNYRALQAALGDIRFYGLAGLEIKLNTKKIILLQEAARIIKAWKEWNAERQNKQQQRQYRRETTQSQTEQNLYQQFITAFNAAESTGESIKKLYRKLSMQHHPDVGGSTEAFQQLSRAYRVFC